MGVVQFVKRVSIVHHINVYRMSYDGLCDQVFCALEDRSHPSAHYHNQERDEFKETMKILKGIGSYLATLMNVDVEDCSIICLEAMDQHINV